MIHIHVIWIILYIKIVPKCYITYILYIYFCPKKIMSFKRIKKRTIVWMTPDVSTSEVKILSYTPGFTRTSLVPQMKCSRINQFMTIHVRIYSRTSPESELNGRSVGFKMIILVLFKVQYWLHDIDLWWVINYESYFD